MNRPLGLYLHVPFCLSKCRYCDFFSGRASETEKEAYVAALEKKITALSKTENVRSFTSVYFGGGTPTAIGAERLTRLLCAVKTVGLAENAEVSFEANPATVTKEDLCALRKSGFNRISIGVQSFVPDELSSLGRIHSASDAEKTVLDALEAGFENVSLDLMLGIPGQTKQSALYSLEKALSLGITHLSAYCLKLEPGTKMFEDYPDGKGLPTDEETADIYLALVSRAEEKGMEQYEISNFARSGFPCRHNILYWELGEYIGLGPSAHSFFGGKRFEFPRNKEFFFENSADPFFGAVSEDLDPETEYVMLSLRTAKGISKEKITQKAIAKMENYVKADFARKTEEGFALTPEGFLVSTHIISDILF